MANEMFIISFSGKQRIGASSFSTSVGILFGPEAFELTKEEIILNISSVSALRKRKFESTRLERYFLNLCCLSRCCLEVF